MGDRDLENLLEFLPDALEMLLDETLRTVPLIADGAGRLMWKKSPGTVVAAGDVLARADGHYVTAPGVGEITNGVKEGSYVGKGHIVGWFTLAHQPEAYKSDLYGLQWLLRKRQKLLSSLQISLEGKVGGAGASHPAVAAFQERLGSLIQSLSAAADCTLTAYKEEQGVAEIEATLLDPQAHALLFRRG